MYVRHRFISLPRLEFVTFLPWRDLTYIWIFISLKEQALDPKTRLLLYKLVNAEILDEINGCISTGKEACVFHAFGGKYVFFYILLQNVL